MVTTIGLLVLALGLFAWVGQALSFFLSGLIMLTRVFLKKAGKKAGSRASVGATYLFGSLWMVSALVMIGLSAFSLCR